VFRPPEPAAVVAAFGLGEAVGSGDGALCRCANTGTVSAAIAAASMICFMTFNFAL
jgi:hypothetical protein